MTALRARLHNAQQQKTIMYFVRVKVRLSVIVMHVATICVFLQHRGATTSPVSATSSPVSSITSPVDTTTLPNESIGYAARSVQIADISGRRFVIPPT